jgi:transposase
MQQEPGDQRVCKRCGKETVVIGYEESSQLDVEPAKYFVLVTKREKRACRSCARAAFLCERTPSGARTCNEASWDGFFLPVKADGSVTRP